MRKGVKVREYQPGRKGRDLADHRFGSLTAIRRAGSVKRGKGRGTRALWLCRCDCGNEVTARSHRLLYSTAHLSCGCIPFKRDARWKYGSKGNGLFARYRRDYLWSSKKRGLEFTLSHDDLMRLLYANCTYCGSPPELPDRLQGIDRVDNDRGYTGDNVVPCCKSCNIAKRNLPLTAFIAWLDRIVAFRSSGLTLSAERG